MHRCILPFQIDPEVVPASLNHETTQDGARPSAFQDLVQGIKFSEYAVCCDCGESMHNSVKAYHTKQNSTHTNFETMTPNHVLKLVAQCSQPQYKSISALSLTSPLREFCEVAGKRSEVRVEYKNYFSSLSTLLDGMPAKECVAYTWCQGSAKFMSPEYVPGNVFRWGTYATATCDPALVMKSIAVSNETQDSTTRVTHTIFVIRAVSSRVVQTPHGDDEVILLRPSAVYRVVSCGTSRFDVPEHLQALMKSHRKECGRVCFVEVRELPKFQVASDLYNPASTVLTKEELGSTTTQRILKQLKAAEILDDNIITLDSNEMVPYLNFMAKERDVPASLWNVMLFNLTGKKSKSSLKKLISSLREAPWWPMISAQEVLEKKHLAAAAPKNPLGYIAKKFSFEFVMSEMEGAPPSTVMSFLQSYIICGSSGSDEDGLDKALLGLAPDDAIKVVRGAFAVCAVQGTKPFCALEKRLEGQRDFGPIAQLLFAEYDNFVDFFIYYLRAIPNAVDAMTPFPNSRSMLQLACRTGHKETIKFVLSERPEIINSTPVRVEGEQEETLYDILCQSGNVETLQWMCQEVPKVNEFSKEDCLFFACLDPNDHLEMVKFLVERDPGRIDHIHHDSKRNCLHIACMVGNKDISQYFVEKKSELMYGIDGRNNTPFVYACRFGNLDVARFLWTLDPNVVLSPTCSEENVLMGTVRASAYVGRPLIPLLNWLAGVHPELLRPDTLETFRKDEQDISPEVEKWLRLRSTAPTVARIFDAACDANLADLKSQLALDPILVHSVDGEGNTLLHIGCEHGAMEVCLHLIAVEPQLMRVKNKHGETPFHRAVWGGHYNLVRHLFELKPAFVGVRDKNGNYPMHVACARGYEDIICFLMECKPELLHLENTTIGESTPLRLLFYHPNRAQLLTVLLECAKGDQKSKILQSSELSLQIYVMISQGDVIGLDELRFMWGRFKSAFGGDTMLHKACQEGNIDLIRHFLQSNIFTCNMVNDARETPFTMAIRQDHVEIVKTMYELRKRDIDEAVGVTSTGNTLLHLVCGSGAVECLKFFLQHYLEYLKIIVNQYNADNETALYRACERGHVFIVILLIETFPTIEINPTDLSIPRPILIACHNGHLHIMRCLHAVNPDVLNECYSTPLETLLHRACKQRYVEVIKFLVQENPCLLTLTNAVGAKPSDLVLSEAAQEALDYRGSDQNEDCVIS